MAAPGSSTAPTENRPTENRPRTDPPGAQIPEPTFPDKVIAPMTIDAAVVAAAVRSCADVIAEHRHELTKLDSAIGDADHGTNLHRGFQAALERLPDPEESQPADILKAVSMALVSKVGGASGPLYGTAFLRAAGAVDGAEQLDATQVVDALEAALAGVQQRGKAELGDKTIVDALSPAVDAARAAVEAGSSAAEALRAAADAAAEGAEATIPLVARKGRASYLGERSAGHKDPGATSTTLLVQTLAEQEGCQA